MQSHLSNYHYGEVVDGKMVPAEAKAEEDEEKLYQQGYFFNSARRDASEQIALLATMDVRDLIPVGCFDAYTGREVSIRMHAQCLASCAGGIVCTIHSQ